MLSFKGKFLFNFVFYCKNEKSVLLTSSVHYIPKHGSILSLADLHSAKSLTQCSLHPVGWPGQLGEGKKNFTYLLVRCLVP